MALLLVPLHQLHIWCEGTRKLFVPTGFIHTLPTLLATDVTAATSLLLQHTHSNPFNGPLCGTTRSAGTRKVKPICILLKQETVSGTGISWAICKSALHSRQIATPAPHHSVFYRLEALPAAQPTASKH